MRSEAPHADKKQKKGSLLLLKRDQALSDPQPTPADPDA
jgi:hypothetical protein